MTRFANNKNKSIELALAAAEQWKRDCLLNGGSVFQPGLQLWTAENMSALARILNRDENNLDTRSSANVPGGLEQLLTEASAELKKLTAECVWLQQLCPYKTYRAETKRAEILAIWQQSGDLLAQDDPRLADELLSGVGGPLQAFATNRWRELQYFVAGCTEILTLPRGERENLLRNPSECSRKLTAVPGGEILLSRHMVLFLLFPEERERSFSSGHRRMIARAFNPSDSRVDEMPQDELDELLYETRKRLEKERGISGLDWYDTSEIATEWKGRHGNAGGPKAILGYACRIRLTSPGYVSLMAALERDDDGNVTRVSSVGPSPRARPVKPEGELILPLSSEDSGKAEKYIAAHRGDGNTRVYFFRGVAGFNAAIGSNLSEPSLAGTGGSAVVLDEDVASADSAAQSAGRQEARNVILYGPPGTGKTYKLNQLLQEYVSEVSEISQKDRWESLAESLTWWEAIALVLEAAGGKAALSDLESHPLLQVKSRVFPSKRGISQQIGNSVWAYSSQNKDLASLPIFVRVQRGVWKLIKDWRDKVPDVPELLSQEIDESETIKSVSRYAYVTFHQSYSYEDFVEGIRPVQDEDSGGVVYRVEPGVFRRICVRARSDPEHRYAMFIDEINRGNISKIFGELITLLEPDKRARYGEDGNHIDGMELTLPYSGDSFGVPQNLDMYGAMNTADRSIALLDTALRRRFEFEELMPDADIIPGADGAGNIEDGEGGSIDLRQLLESMNRRIRFLLDREHMIGHSYFMDIEVFADLRRVLTCKVLPLLQEYFYEDWSRIQLVLRDRIGDERKLPQIIRDEPVEEMQVLGFDHDDYEDKVEYEKVAESEITPAAVRKIYEA